MQIESDHQASDHRSSARLLLAGNDHLWDAASPDDTVDSARDIEDTTTLHLHAGLAADAGQPLGPDDGDEDTDEPLPLRADAEVFWAVSYTHLTLPTICSV
eukprot:2840517-Alexandrium_andersonii.AAC.1